MLPSVYGTAFRRANPRAAERSFDGVDRQRWGQIILLGSTLWSRQYTILDVCVRLSRFLATTHADGTLLLVTSTR